MVSQCKNRDFVKRHCKLLQQCFIQRELLCPITKKFVKKWNMTKDILRPEYNNLMDVQTKIFKKSKILTQEGIISPQT